MKYDYLIIGAGLYGSVFAHEMNKLGKKCLVIEKRNHIGGNCYTDKKDNIDVHVYGAHIFHTNDKRIWNYVNSLVEFNNYKHSVKINYKNKIFSFPINLMTLNQLWGVNTPEEAENKLKSVIISNENPNNLEDWCLSQVGEEIYKTFIKEYTQKQWNKPPSSLPQFIIKRLPIRLNFDDNYYFDNFQGIPKDGYTNLFEKLLDGIDLELNVDYFSNRDHYNSLAKKIVYTGKIDEFYNYCFGNLEYRSLTFEHKKIERNDYQGCSVINYTSLEDSHTRIIEHKHFNYKNSDVTWITKEYPKNYENNNDTPYYPINDEKNTLIYDKYRLLSQQEKNVIFGGRLAEYKYYDMHQVIAAALSKTKKEIENEN